MDNPGRDIQYQKNLDIDGEVYKTHLLMPTPAFRMGMQLAKYIGEPIAQFAATQGEDGKIADVLPKAVKALLTNMQTDEVLDLVKALVSTCTFKNKPISFEEHFQGRMGTLMKLSMKVIEVQFSDFFAATLESIGQAMGRAKESATAA